MQGPRAVPRKPRADCPGLICFAPLGPEWTRPSGDAMSPGGSPLAIDHRPVRGGFLSGWSAVPGADVPLAINRRLAEADCWSDAMPFPGAGCVPGY